MARAARAMAMATKVVGDLEGNGNSGKGNRDGDEDVKWPFATILSTCVLRIVAKGYLTKVKNKGSVT
jgi:hypothetical protein